MEYVDVFDENYHLIGSASKKEVHEKGLWHQVFSCLFVNTKENKVYLQYKNASHNDVAHQNKLDISVGGHLLKGEQVKDGIREIKEESSLDVPFDKLISFGVRKIDKYINDNYRIREFSHLFIYDSVFNLNDLQSTDDEVLYFVEFDIDELISFVKNPTKVQGLTPQGLKEFKEPDFITAYIEDDHLYLNYLLLVKMYMQNEDPTKLNWSYITKE